MPELEAAQQHLPGWVGWIGSLWLVLGTTLVSALGMRWLAERVARRLERGNDIHWSERARRAFRARGAAQLSVVALPALSGACAYWFRAPFSRVPASVVSVSAALCSFLACAAVVARADRRWRTERPSLRRWLEGSIVPLVALYPMFPLIGILALTAPAEFDARLIPWSVAGIAGFAVCLFVLPLRLLVWLGVVRCASARLEACVSAAAARSGTHPKATYEVPWLMANAVALPLSGHLVFTDTAVRQLADAELTAVAAHEIAHLSEPRSVLAVRIALAASWLPLAAVAPVGRALGAPGLLGLMGAIALVHLLTRRMRVRMEERADRAARHHESDDGDYARALEKLYEVNLMPVVQGRAGTHPHLYDRLIAAGHAPGYARPPAPPSALPSVLTMYACFIALPLTFFVTPLLLPASTEASRALAIGLRGNAEDLAALSSLREANGDDAAAIALSRAATAIGPDDPRLWQTRVRLHAKRGECAEAADVAIEARARGARRWPPHLRERELRIVWSTVASCADDDLVE